MIDIRPTDPPARGTVVVLHGWGASGRDVEPLALSLRLPHLRYVIPDAQFEVPGTGGMGKGWFTLPAAQESVGERETSMGQVFGLLDTLQREGVPVERVVLMGFSQGGSLSLDVAFTYPKRVAGVVSLSGFVSPPLQERIRQGGGDDLPVEIPIFAGHGTADTIVPLNTGKSSFEVLKEKGFNVAWHEYDSGHHVVVEELEDIREFLLNLFPEA